MTRSPGRYSYTVFTRASQLATLYRLMREQDLLWAVWPDVDEWTEDMFISRLSEPGRYVLGAEVDGNPAGALMLWPFGYRTLVAEIGLTALRPYFGHAVPMCLGALDYVISTFDPRPTAFVGRVPRQNRHILRLLSQLGFGVLANVPGLIWHTRKQDFVGGSLVMATTENIIALQR